MHLATTSKLLPSKLGPEEKKAYNDAVQKAKPAANPPAEAAQPKADSPKLPTECSKAWQSVSRALRESMTSSTSLPGELISHIGYLGSDWKQVSFRNQLS
ncbi:MAG: hypothetical protein ABUL49_00415 [bacterium]